MKYLMGAMAAAFAAVFSCTTPAIAQPSAELQNPQIEIVYVSPRNPAFRPIHQRLTQRGVLEELKQFLAPLKLSRKLTVRIDECGALTQPFKPGGPATICYELVNRMEQIAQKAPQTMQPVVVVGAFVQVTLHEVALAVMDILDVPVWGRRADAADQFAAFIMLQFGDDVARQTIIGTATMFELSGKSWTGSDFSDVASPEAQRYFNYLCIAYGGAPKTFQFLVTPESKGAEPILPRDRAVRCAREYAQIRKAFNLRIMPYVDPDLLVKVRAMGWVVK
jgi:hypothetical protein